MNCGVSWQLSGSAQQIAREVSRPVEEEEEAKIKKLHGAIVRSRGFYQKLKARNGNWFPFGGLGHSVT